jgi:RNA polymerase sigma-70 factor (ECF subfamily)
LLEDLHARYRVPLLAYFQRRSVSRAEAEDLTQEVFLRIAGRPEGENRELAEGFIFTVAANLLRDQARRARSRSSGNHLSLEAGEVPPDDGAALVETLEPERILMSREVLARVLRALDLVPPRTRDIFLLFRLEGMRQREIAHLHGISVSAVEKHIVKALKQLAREFA